MEKGTKKTLTILTILFLIITIILITLKGCNKILDMLSPCTKQYLKEIPSPNDYFKAIIFVTECGMTTDFTTNIAILPNDEDASNWDKEDIVLRVKSWQKIDLKWVNSKELHIEYDETPKVYTYTKVNEFEGIKIKYTERKNLYDIWQIEETKKIYKEHGLKFE